MKIESIEDYRGFRVRSKELAHWVPLLEEWLVVIERFSRLRGGGDSPFGYRERSNVGFIAAAAWRSGFVALNEFKHKKKSNHGRADLLIQSSEWIEIIEAKFDWIDLNENFGKKLEKLRALARKDARDSFRPKIHDRALGLAVGGGKAKCERGRVNDAIEQALDSCSELQSAFFAYCFPKPERTTETNKKNEYTPGVILVGDVVRS